ncbi:MAG: tetratricopeptide repeat protein, partial [Acidobacteriota bacterium]
MKPVDVLKRLERRLRDDPASKVFLPLAEEHRKAGRTAKAVTILRTGLKENPRYAAARVALGRLLLEQGRKREARLELEEAVRQAPDNLMGARLLAEARGTPPGDPQKTEPPDKEPP